MIPIYFYINRVFCFGYFCVWNYFYVIYFNFFVLCKLFFIWNISIEMVPAVAVTPFTVLYYSFYLFFFYLI